MVTKKQINILSNIFRLAALAMLIAILVVK